MLLLVILIALLVSAKSANVDRCITPNLEPAFCVPLQDCPLLYYGIRTLNEVVFDFAKKSVCKTEGDTPYVCCGASSRLTVQSCVTPNQDEGKCVRLESCPIIFNGIKTFNQTVIEFAARSVCNADGNVQYVCCGPSNYLKKKPDTSIDLNVGASSETTTISWTRMILQGSLPKRRLVSDRRYCGYQHTDDRLYNENDTALDEFPWLALLIHENDTVKDQQYCLGTLINNRYVLTTAVCVNNTDNEYGFKIKSVKLGRYNTNATKDCVISSDYEECLQPIIKVGAEETILHPSYKLDINGINFNIALIRLSNAIGYTDYIRPICLPEIHNARVGDALSTTGRGTTVFEANRDIRSKIKKRGDGFVSPLRKCVENSEINLEGAVSEKYHICFSEGANGSCIDDTSAPLMSKSKNQWQLEGILSFPVAWRCGNGELNIYTNITTHLEWIINTVKP